MNNNKDIAPFNTKCQRDGYWEIYCSDGYLMYKCVYHYGKEIGYEENYSYYPRRLIKRYHIL